MTISDEGIELIKAFEGFRGKAYRDAVGVWTIGYGHTKSVEPDDFIDDSTATLLLRNDVQEAERTVVRFASDNGLKFNQNQFDALVSFVFNVGSGNFLASTMAIYLRQKNFNAAAQQFGKWVKGNGNEVLPGLVTRRTKEMNLFLTPERDRWTLVCPPDDWKGATVIPKEAFNTLVDLAKTHGIRYRVDNHKLYLGIRHDSADNAPAIKPTTPKADPPKPDTKKWFDFHLVCNLKKRISKLYAASGKFLGAFPMRGEGVEGGFAYSGRPLWTVRNSDTPPGEWRFSAVEKISSRHDVDIPYGRMFVYMEPISGEAKRVNRPGIGAHGGGSGLWDPFADRQGWVITHGCLRYQNIDLETIIQTCTKGGKLQKVKVTTTWDG